MDNWIDITDQCTYHLTQQSGNIKYNSKLKLVIGYINTITVVKNQQNIITLPQLEGIGTNSYKGICGVVSYDSSVTFNITVVIDGNVIKTSHSQGLDATGEKTYFICFVAS